MLCAPLRLASLTSLLLLLIGCEPAPPPRYRLSGVVQYDGRPVPAGYIVFASPHGPGAQADIHNGQYETADGYGTIGGPHTVTVYGFDGKPVVLGQAPQGEPYVNPMGKPMFRSFTMEVDIPRETAVRDIQIPKQESSLPVHLRRSLR